MRVLGVVGRNGSGKDAVVDYLQRRCAVNKLSSGDIAREIAADEGLEPTRENLHEISRRYAREHGPDYWMRRIADRIEREGWERAGITGIRAPVDVETLRVRFGDAFTLVHVQVDDPRVRYERLKARGTARDPGGAHGIASFSAFLAHDREERELFDIDETVRLADILIPNNGTLAELYRRIDDLLVGDLVRDCQESG